MKRNRYYNGPLSKHFDGLRFINPNEPCTDRSLIDVLRWKLARQAVAWPSTVQVIQTIPPDNSDAIRITMVGHATLLIQVSGVNILTDPVWSHRASPVSYIGPKRVTIPGIAFEHLPAIHFVLISHNHYDHMDIPTLRQLHAVHRPLMIMPLGNDTIIQKHIPQARILTGDWHAQFQINANINVIVTPANHWSGRGLGDRRMALWCGFLIKTHHGNIWFAGDTAYGTGKVFQAIKTTYGAPDVALIPIGAYAPRWFMAAQHVNPKEAVAIFTDLSARYALGIHWGTFQLTDESREQPKHALLTAVQKADISTDRFIAAEPGHDYNF